MLYQYNNASRVLTIREATLLLSLLPRKQAFEFAIAHGYALRRS